MYARAALLFSCLSLLSACGSVPQGRDAQEAVLQDKLQSVLTDYNLRHHSHVEMPALSIDDAADRPAMIASANYSGWSISVNRLWLKKDPCIVYKEAMAHELAHLLLDYQQYGMPRATTMVTRSGPVVVAFNGPPDLQDSAVEHGKDWQELARELGAHPCKEGYCRSEDPYSKSPLSCSTAEYALLHATPPAAPAKSVPHAAASAPAGAVAGNASWTSSRTIFDSQAAGARH